MSTSLRGPPCPSTEWSALPCTPYSLYPFSAFSLALPPSLLSCVHVGTASPARTSALEGNLVLFAAVSTRPQNSMVQTLNIFKIKIIPLVLGGLWCSNIKMPQSLYNWEFSILYHKLFCFLRIKIILSLVIISIKLFEWTKIINNTLILLKSFILFIN